MVMLVTDRDVIIALGGPESLAAALGHSEFAVEKWVQADRGIPWKYRLQVAKLAASKRIKLPPAFTTFRVTGTAPKQRRAA